LAVSVVSDRVPVDFGVKSLQMFDSGANETKFNLSINQSQDMIFGNEFFGA